MIHFESIFHWVTEGYTRKGHTGTRRLENVHKLMGGFVEKSCVCRCVSASTFRAHP